MTVLIIFNRHPYDNSDVNWNGLRLANTLHKAGHTVNMFLMNDAVDMVRDACKKPEGYDQDLGHFLKELIAKGIVVKVCGTCMARCGIHRNQPYFEGALPSTMAELAEWIIENDKVISI